MLVCRVGRVGLVCSFTPLAFLNPGAFYISRLPLSAFLGLVFKNLKPLFAH